MVVGASTVDKPSVGSLGFRNRLPRESGFIPPGSGALCITRRGFFCPRNGTSGYALHRRKQLVPGPQGSPHGRSRSIRLSNTLPQAGRAAAGSGNAVLQDVRGLGIIWGQAHGRGELVHTTSSDVVRRLLRREVDATGTRIPRVSNVSLAERLSDRPATAAERLERKRWCACSGNRTSECCAVRAGRRRQNPSVTATPRCSRDSSGETVRRRADSVTSCPPRSVTAMRS